MKFSPLFAILVLSISCQAAEKTPTLPMVLHTSIEPKRDGRLEVSFTAREEKPDQSVRPPRPFYTVTCSREHLPHLTHSAKLQGRFIAQGGDYYGFSDKHQHELICAGLIAVQKHLEGQPKGTDLDRHTLTTRFTIPCIAKMKR